ncbi:hypothetical protein [Legionella sp. km772]|uniref:hypothetical protein n=1 Tax=Legionella sp. km772 TaxID=2498111 RepID=UPI000F8D507A|nr:hypothetical protein [Legionella sp. km772]RUR08110.1 hypothetical protein ELY15_11500 [Legionella sp. km772]
MELENNSLHASSLVQSLKEINKFIKGGEYKALKQSMKGYDRHLIQFKRDFYLLTVYAGRDYQSSEPILESGQEDNKHDNTAIIEELETLLTNLSIPKYRWGKYLNSQLTVYDLLCQLNADLQIKANIQLHTIIELLEERKARNKRLYLIASITAALLLIASLVSPFLMGIIAVAKIVFASSIAFPIMGLLFTVGRSAFYAYQNHFDKKSSLFNRLRDNSFLLLNAALNVSGNIVWLASSTVIAPVASVTLFLLSSVVDVVKEVFAAVQNYLLYKDYKAKNDSPLLNQDLHNQQEQARHQIGYRQHRNAAIINTVAAVLLLGIMIAWQFIPGGIFVTMGAIAAIGIVYQVQRMVLKANQNTMRDQLQTELRQLETSYEQTNGIPLEDVNSWSLVKSLKREPSLDLDLEESPQKLKKLKGDEGEDSPLLEAADCQEKQKPPKKADSSFNYAVASDASFFKHLTKEQVSVEELSAKPTPSIHKSN